MHNETNEITEEKDKKKIYWVLAIDGGGIRGLMSSMIVTKIGDLIGETPHHTFDMLAGVSIGALIAASIAQCHKCEPKTNLVSLFCKENVHTIFDKSFMDDILPIQFKPKYDGKGKKQVIKKHTFVKKFGELCIPTAIGVYSLNPSHTKILRSWEDKDLDLQEVLDATSAAPTYFPCTKIGNKWYMDGGVSTNNTALLALSEARRKWGKDADIRILSIGTGDNLKVIDGDSADDWGLPRWAYNGLVDIIMEAPTDFMCSTCCDFMKEGHFLRLDHQLSELNIDDTSDEYRKELEDSAKSVLVKNSEKIKNFFKDF